MKILSLIPLFLCLYLVGCGDERPVANMPDEPLAQPLEIVIEPKKVAMTKTWAAGVKDDGTLWTWGSGGGKIRKTTTGQPVDPTPMPVEGVNDAVAVSAGSAHMILLKKDGTVWGWGHNSHGQISLNAGKNLPSDEMRKIEGISDVVDISAGSQNSFFITRFGDVYILGDNTKGLYGEPMKKLAKPTKIEALSNIVKIKGTPEYFLALDKDGNLYSSSIRPDNLGGEPSLPIIHSDGTKIYPPIKINLPKKVVDFDTGYARVLLLEDGTVWSWGSSQQSAQSVNKDIDVPTQVKGLSRVIKIEKESAHTSNGHLYAWGKYAYDCNWCFPNGYGSTTYYRPVLIAQDIQLYQYIDSLFINGYIDKHGKLWTWSAGIDGLSGTGYVTQGKWGDKEKILTLEQSLFTTH